MNWIAMILVLLGYYLVSRKKRSGFIFGGLGSVIFTIWFFGTDWAAVALNIVWVGISIKSYLDWE